MNEMRMLGWICIVIKKDRNECTMNNGNNACVEEGMVL